MTNNGLLTADIADTVRCVANVLADTATSTGDRARVIFSFRTQVASGQRWYMSRRHRRAISNVAAAVIATVRGEATAGVAASVAGDVTAKDMLTIPARLSAAARHVQAGLDRERSYQLAARDDD